MAIDIKLPELGEGVTEGELIKWLVKPGDTIKPDQAVAEIMTDKATVEVPSPVSGVVKELKFKAGDIIKVESVILTADSTSGASVKSSPTAATTSATTAAKSMTGSSPQTTTQQVVTSAAGSTETKNVKLPELGEGVTEGELIKWLVKPGDTIKPDQAVAEIMTDKATVEVPSPMAGVVQELKFKAGEIIKVESVILTVKSSGGTPTNVDKPQALTSTASSTSSTSSAPSVSTVATAQAQSSHSQNFFPPVADSKVLATPATRRLAREMGVDLNQLSGSGLAGRVTREDVLSAKDTSGSTSSAASGATAASSASFKFPTAKPSYSSNMAELEERVDLRGIRKKIAENLQMAKSIIPHFTLMDEVDVTELVKFRESLKEYAEKNQTKITYLPFVMKALIATIKEFPQFNASIDDAASQIVYKKYFNIGFAADTPNGLVVPVIKNADHKTITEISKEIIDLSKRARDGKLKPEEMKGASITITNIGSVGGTYATPIINHPEVAILGMYKIQDKPVIHNGQLASVKVMNYTITCDHRLIDGAVAANFLKSFFQKIQNPAILMMNMM